MSCVLRGRVATSRGLRGLPGVRVSLHVERGGGKEEEDELSAGFTLTRMPGGQFDFAVPRCPAGSKASDAHKLTQKMTFFSFAKKTI